MTVRTDPLAGLSAYEKQRIILLPKTWSERWRLCNPELTPTQRRDLVLTILTERRALYDQWFERRVQAAVLERAHKRHLDGEMHLTDFGRSTALASFNEIHRVRQQPSLQATRYREAYWAERNGDREEARER
jgi:hypothetical protein